MKSKALPILVILAFSFLAGAVIVVPSIPAASALPIIQTQTQTCTGSFPATEAFIQCTLTFTPVTDANSYMIIIWTADNGTETTCLVIASCSLVAAASFGIDSQDLSGVQWEGLGFSTPFYGSDAQIIPMSANIGYSSAVLVISLSNSQDMSLESVNMYAIQIHGLDPGGFSCPGSFDCSQTGSGTSYSMSPSNAGTDPSFLYFGAAISKPSDTLTADAGYTQLAESSDSDFSSIGQYKISASDGEAISGTMSASTGWLMTGEIFGLEPAGYPTVISSMYSGLATSPTYPTKDMTFLADGLTWAFYSNGTGGGYVCSTSSNLGLTWTSPKELYWGISMPGGQQALSSYYYKTTNTLAIVYSDNSLTYRTAQLSSGGCGSISYNAAYTVIDFVPYWGTSSGPGYASITVDSTGHAWIEFSMVLLGGHAAETCLYSDVCRMVIEDSDIVTSGGWSFAADPMKMFTTPGVSEAASIQTAEIVPTGSGVTFLAANGTSGTIYARSFVSGSWDAVVGTTGTITAGCTGFSPACALPGYYAWSAMQDPAGNVHITYQGSDGFLHYTIFYPANNSMRADFKLNGGSSFSLIAYAYPAIDLNGTNVYVFWVNDNETYYQAEIAGVWGSATPFFSDVFNEYTAGYAYMPQISSRSQDFIGGIYTLDYQMKFFYLAPAPSSNATVCVKYTIIGGGSYNPPVLTYLRVNGSSATLTLKYTLTCISTKTGDTYSITNPLTGISASGQERAITQNMTSSTFPSSSNYNFVYWHQLFVPVSYTITDGTATNHPTFTYLEFGGTQTITNEKYATSYWIDYNSHWTAESPFTTSPGLVSLTGHPPSGQAASLQPIIIAYYASSSCGNSNPLTEIENLCVIPGVVDAWSYGIGVAPWLGFVLLGVNVAIYNKNQNVWLSLLVLWVTGAVFSAVLPAYVSEVAQVFLYLGIAGLGVKTILLSR